MIKRVCICDICGKETQTENLNLPVYRMFDANDGRTFYDEPHISFRHLDICPECLMKVTNIKDESVMGYGDMIIRKNPKLD